LHSLREVLFKRNAHEEAGQPVTINNHKYYGDDDLEVKLLEDGKLAPEVAPVDDLG